METKQTKKNREVNGSSSLTSILAQLEKLKEGNEEQTTQSKGSVKQLSRA